MAQVETETVQETLPQEGNGKSRNARGRRSKAKAKAKACTSPQTEVQAEASQEALPEEDAHEEEEKVQSEDEGSFASVLEVSWTGDQEPKVASRVCGTYVLGGMWNKKPYYVKEVRLEEKLCYIYVSKNEKKWKISNPLGATPMFAHNYDTAARDPGVVRQPWGLWDGNQAKFVECLDLKIDAPIKHGNARASFEAD